MEAPKATTSRSRRKRKKKETRKNGQQLHAPSNKAGGQPTVGYPAEGYLAGGCSARVHHQQPMRMSQRTWPACGPACPGGMLATHPSSALGGARGYPPLASDDMMCSMGLAGGRGDLTLESIEREEVFF